jgi:hypothetical protein
MTKRKYIRIALTPEDEAAFAQAKTKAEAESKLAMSDSAYALSLIRWAIAK